MALMRIALFRRALKFAVMSVVPLFPGSVAGAAEPIANPNLPKEKKP